MILSVNELLFQYRNRVILHDIVMNVRNGEIVAILGQNGVGKTTLLKCLNHILRPKKGVIYLAGDPIEGLSSREIARRAGYVPQQVEIGRITAFDAVLLGRRPHISWDVTSHDLIIVDAIFHRLSMDHLRLQYLDEMSGGELQKVAIARAIVQEPKVLLLDEPTSSLDLKNQMEIMATISQVVKEHGISVVMTMHDLNQAVRFADQFLFMKNGSVHAYGGLDIVTEKVIEEVYGLKVIIGTIRGITCIVPGLCSSSGKYEDRPESG